MSWIEPGRKYKLRDGKTAEVVRVGTLQFGIQNRNEMQVLVGHIGKDPAIVTWDMDGKFAEEGQHDFDIVKPRK